MEQHQQQEQAVLQANWLRTTCSSNSNMQQRNVSVIYFCGNDLVDSFGSLLASPLRNYHQQQQQQHQQQEQQQQHKLPTVVYLSADGSSAVGSALQRNAASGGVGAGVGGGGGGGAAATASGGAASDWLLLKEAQQRRRLLMLAIAFTVLGAAIGALAIYFAGVQQQRCQRCQLTDAGEQEEQHYCQKMLLSLGQAGSRQ